MNQSTTPLVNGLVILGYGPQPMNWIANVSSMCGNDAVVANDVARMAGADMAGGTPAALDVLREQLRAGAIELERRRHQGAPVGAVEWLAVGERGSSSEALFTRLSGINAVTHQDTKAHPLDPADFRRCRLMLEAVPLLEQKLPQATDLSPKWFALIRAWPELCDLMDRETPDWRVARAQAAPKLYAAIKKVLGEQA